MEYENKDLCSKCGGRCCKKSGCDYFVSDFKSIDKNTILKILETGNVSIVSAFKFEILTNGKEVVVPILYLRARNEDRGIIDLFSMKKRCSMLTSTGCSYNLEQRPGGGVNLIPNEKDCKPLNNPLDELKKWYPYQNLLAKMVKRYTGKTVDMVLKSDVEEVFYEVLSEKFDGVDKLEIADISRCLPDLVKYYPEEYIKAKNRKNNEIKLIRNK